MRRQGLYFYTYRRLYCIATNSNIYASSLCLFLVNGMSEMGVKHIETNANKLFIDDI